MMMGNHHRRRHALLLEYSPRKRQLSATSHQLITLWPRREAKLNSSLHIRTPDTTPPPPTTPLHFLQQVLLL